MKTHPHYDPAALGEWVRRGGPAIMAMQSGGCARYLLSSRIVYHIGEDGFPRFRHDAGNEHIHRLLTHSTMTLIIDRPPGESVGSPDQIVLTGEMREMPECDAQEMGRLYRFKTQRAHVALESGEKIPLDAETLLRG